jgi:hypothetical protein
MTVQSIRALIEAALGDLHIAACQRCGGWGTVGLPSLPALCPVCLGAGRVVTNERESHDTNPG